MKFDLNSINFDWARNIWQDLRNKRLLPVAAVLVLALIAVPFLFGRSDDPAPVDAIAVSNADDSPQLDSIAVKEQRPNGQDVGGKPVNPFQQPAQPKASTTSTTATEAPAAGADTGSTGSTGDAPKTDSGSSKKSSGPSTAYEIDIKFGTPGNTKSKKNVAALTPFPSADDAYVVYLGAIDKGKTAVFLISTDVTATGDGICDPSEKNCKTVEMAVGDTELFQVEDAAGTTAFAQYELKLVKIHK